MTALIADGDLRAIGVQQRSFEAMIRERPEIALAIMPMLADRLTSASISEEVPR
jgi:CRP-like cAMP-binding protein